MESGRTFHVTQEQEKLVSLGREVYLGIKRERRARVQIMSRERKKNTYAKSRSDLTKGEKQQWYPNAVIFIRYFPRPFPSDFIQDKHIVRIQ